MVIDARNGDEDDTPVLYCTSCGAGIPRSAFPEPGSDSASYTCPQCGQRGMLDSAHRA